MNFLYKKLDLDKSVILKNLSYLTLMRFFNIGFKFAIISYLISVLGEINYGLVTWLDSVVQYFLMIINFGFNIYVAKYIIDFKEDKRKINEVVSSVLIIKSALFVFSIIVIAGMCFLKEFNPYRELLFLFIFMGLGEVLFPIWFFQGKENLKPATFIVFISRLFLVIATLFFVTQEEDVFKYILLLVFSSILMGVMGIVYVFRSYNVSFIWVTFKKLKFYLKESFPFFLGRFLLLAFNFGTIFIIGKFCGLEQVTGFDISLKVIMIGVIPFEMLQQAVFPTISRTQNKKMLKQLAVGAFIIGGLVGFITFLFAEQIILLFGGEELLEFVPALKMLCMLSPFVALTYILGTCSLVAFGYYKEYNFSLISTSLIYLLILVVLYFTNQITFWNLIYLRIFGDVLMSLVRMYFTIKKGILSFNFFRSSYD